MQKSDIHILIISSWYPTDNNPFLGNFVQRQAKLLASKYKVTVIHTMAKNGGEIYFNKSQNDGFNQVVIEYNGNGHIFARKKQERKALIHGLNQLGKVDLIIGNVLLPRGWQFLLAKKKFDCPLFYIEHGSYFREKSPFKWSRIHMWMLKKMRKHATQIIAVSEVLKKDMKPDFSNRSIKIIGNHIDLNLFEAKQKVKGPLTQFLHISTLDPFTKNPNGIIEACALLKEENDNFKLTIICDEPTDDWQAHTKNINLQNNIEFIGPLQWNELVPYYQNADAFVLFSEYETFSIVLAEAWATGTPVISTSVGVASKMNSSLGIQVKQDDSEDLKNAMMKLMNGEVSFNQEVLTQKASEYSEDSILTKWTNLIDANVR